MKHFKWKFIMDAKPYVNLYKYIKKDTHYKTLVDVSFVLCYSSGDILVTFDNGFAREYNKGKDFDFFEFRV